VFELGIHHISRPLYSLPAAVAALQSLRASDGGRLEVPTDVVVVGPEVGFVHHYRDCSSDYEYDFNCNVAAFVSDDRLAAVGYIPTLRNRIQARLRAVRQRTADRQPTTAASRSVAST